MLIPRVSLTGTTDVATISTPAVSLMVYNTATTADVTPSFYYWNGTAWTTLGGSSSTTLSIGDTHAGGIIFYLDGSGQHGLVAKSTDESGTYAWSSSYTTTYAEGSGIYEGEHNTNKIISIMGAGNAPATEQCAGLTDGGYMDWYLPSRIELDIMYENIGPGDALGIGNVGGFASSYYWSSTEYSKYNAWSHIFDDGYQFGDSKVNTSRVRAVRAF